MAPTIGRLKKRPDFLRVAAARRKWVTPGLILQTRRRESQENRGSQADAAAARPVCAGRDRVEQIRVGFTVSRKVGDAVRRNRARRRLRAAAAAVVPVLGRAGCDYVLIGRGGTLERSYADLLQDLRTALKGLAREAGRDACGS